MNDDATARVLVSLALALSLTACSSSDERDPSKATPDGVTCGDACDCSTACPGSPDATTSGTGGSSSASSASSGMPGLPSNGNSWFVATTGTASGDGTMGNPWDLATALAGPASVQPGDTIWIRAGKYGEGQPNSIVYSSLVGTTTAPILVRAYPGERVTIDAWLQVGCCDGANDPAKGSYTWFWGLEFASFNPDRTSGTSGPPEWAAQQNHASADTWGAGTKFINCIVHDTSGGISVWNAADTEVVGNIVFNVGGYGTDRGHGHDFYMDNRAPSVIKATDNIGFDSFDMGMHTYGSSDSSVQNIELRGNVIFNSGQPYYGELTDNLALGGGSGGPSGIVVDTNTFYQPPGENQGYNELGMLWTPLANDAVVTNNHFIGGQQAIDIERWTSLTFQNNTVYAMSGDDAMLIYNTGQSPTSYTYGNNHYFGSGQFRIDPNCGTWPCPSSEVVDFAAWQSSTGLDQGSTYAPTAPTGISTMIRPNAYEPGRANIVVYDWDLAPSVDVDLSASGIHAGDSYEIRDAENWYGGAVISGVYGGAPVTIPMTGLAIVQPFGTVPHPAVHTAPELGVFVLLSGMALANTY